MNKIKQLILYKLTYTNFHFKSLNSTIYFHKSIIYNNTYKPS